MFTTLMDFSRPPCIWTIDMSTVRCRVSHSVAVSCALWAGQLTTFASFYGHDTRNERGECEGIEPDTLYGQAASRSAIPLILHGSALQRPQIPPHIHPSRQKRAACSSVSHPCSDP